MAKNMELDIDSVLKGTGANRTFSSEDRKERMGRPRLEEADKANKRITLYCTEAEYNFIEEYCKKNFISKNLFLRSLINKKMDMEE